MLVYTTFFFRVSHYHPVTEIEGFYSLYTSYIKPATEPIL
jgi:hypothetical protein